MPGSPDTESLDRARRAKATVLREFRRLGTVVGVGITRVDGEYAVKVNLARAVEGVALPSEVDGVPVRVEVVGAIRPRTPEPRPGRSP